MAERRGIKRKALSITDKLNILKNYEEKSKTKNQKEIAAELNVPASTLRTILANRKKIEDSAVIGGCKRQKIKHAKFEQLEQILLDWFNQARALNLTLQSTVILSRRRPTKLPNACVLIILLDPVVG